MNPDGRAAAIRGPLSRGLFARGLFAIVLALGFWGPAAANPATSPADRFEPADSLEGNYLAALAAQAGRDSAAAAVYFREALRADPRNQDLLERGFVAFLADGAMSDAFRAAERLLQRNSSNALAQLALATRALKSRQYQTARNLLRSGARASSNDITATLLTGWAFAGSGDQNRTFETIDRLRGDASFTLFRDYHGGLMASLLGNQAEATRRLKAAYDTDPNTLRTVDAWARQQARRGDVAGARETYERFDRLLPNHPIIRDGLAQIARTRGGLRAVSTVQQGAAEVFYALGSSGNRDDGEATIVAIYFRLALYLDPGHELAILTLGDLLDRAKLHEDAIAVYERMPERSPLKANAEIQIGFALEALDRKDEAVEHFNAAVSARPQDIEPLVALGNVYRARKDFAQAVDYYEKALAMVPEPRREHWSLFYSRGIAYERTKQWPKAEADFRKALELIPESMGSNRALVLNYLGYSWVDQGLNLGEALPMLRSAVELRPRDGYIIDSLGWAYYRLGRHEDAVRELERAVALKPADPVINDHLGDAYWKVGRQLEARFQWNHARDLGPEPEELPKILRKIDSGLPDDPPSAVELDATGAPRGRTSEGARNGG